MKRALVNVQGHVDSCGCCLLCRPCLPAYLLTCRRSSTPITTAGAAFPCAVLQAAEEARRAEVSELELAVKAVQAVAETHKLQASEAIKAAEVLERACHIALQTASMLWSHGMQTSPK